MTYNLKKKKTQNLKIIIIILLLSYLLGLGGLKSTSPFTLFF